MDILKAIIKHKKQTGALLNYKNYHFIMCGKNIDDKDQID